MNIFLKLAFLFSVGSSVGWMLELIFRRFFTGNKKEKKWVNPGFLKGPCLPLYGLGLCILYLLARLGDRSDIFLGLHGRLLLILLMAALLTFLEYIAGCIFVKRLKIPLWDYSDEKGNIGGIICPRFSLFWAIISAIYYFFIDRYIVFALEWFSEETLVVFAIGFYMGAFLYDLLSSLKSTVSSFDFKDRIDNFKNRMHRKFGV